MFKRIFATIAAVGFAGTAMALHDGGVAHCDACHTMHNSQDNAAETTKTQFLGYPYLLKGADQSSTCLNCHESTSAGSYHISTPSTAGLGGALPINFTPGGDFAWVKKDYQWTSRGNTYNEAGSTHGHNIIAADFGYVQDSVLTESPGGSYPADILHCTSCHDPHGQYRIDINGNTVTTGLPIAGRGSHVSTNTHNNPSATWAVGTYRLLAGVGYEPQSVKNSGAVGVSFSNDVPAAMADGWTNGDESTNQQRVAYGENMSEWCANCHGDMLQSGYVSGDPDQKHPSGNNALLTTVVANNYNAYVSSGIMTGSQATSFLSLTPYESGDGNDTTGRTNMATVAAFDSPTYAGPSTSDNVMCLSCHRAHASGWPDALRFMETDTFITEDDGAGGVQWAHEMGRLDPDLTAAYYGRTPDQFGLFQRVLCNKCHAQD